MNESEQQYTVEEGRCAGGEICPLSSIKVGMTVCIKQLTGAPETSDRLRELGFCEQQRIKLLSKHANLVCLVCNSRLGISEKIAESILVENVPNPA